MAMPLGASGPGKEEAPRKCEPGCDAKHSARATLLIGERPFGEAPTGPGHPRAQDDASPHSTKEEAQKP